MRQLRLAEKKLLRGEESEENSGVRTVGKRSCLKYLQNIAKEDFEKTYRLID